MEDQNAGNLEARVRAWLARQGYPLELRVARLFAKMGWATAHAVIYNDPDTGKPCECDVVATIGHGKLALPD